MAKIDPKPKPRQSTGPRYLNINPMNAQSMQAAKAQANLTQAIRFQNSLRGADGNLINSTDTNPYTAQNLGGIGGGASGNYVYVDPAALQRADSVVNASRAFLKKSPTSIRGARFFQ